MPHKDWCKHYNGLASNKECRAGVRYDTLKPADRTHFVLTELPCLGHTGPSVAKCDKCEFRAPEEIAAEEAASNLRFENFGKARAAIVAVAPWKKRGDPGHSGAIPCPVCSAGTLRFTRAARNGHIHAACSTAGCVRWME